MSASQCEVSFTVNGDAHTVSVYPMERLLDVLRTELRLTGAKEGCGEGECGSCSVLMNGELVNSCLVPVLQAQGATLCTIEGLARTAFCTRYRRRFSNAEARSAASVRRAWLWRRFIFCAAILRQRWNRFAKGWAETCAAAPAIRAFLKRC